MSGLPALAINQIARLFGKDKKHTHTHRHIKISGTLFYSSLSLPPQHNNAWPILTKRKYSKLQKSQTKIHF